MSNGYVGLQVSLKDARGALLNITGSTPAELSQNYAALAADPTFAGFFTLTPAQVQEALNPGVPLPTPGPVPAAPAAPAPTKSIKEPGLPATEKQKALIVKRGGTVTEGMTKGQAGALIDQLLAGAN